MIVAVLSSPIPLWATCTLVMLVVRVRAWVKARATGARSRNTL